MSASADLHDVWETRRPLGVACRHCLHRALIEPARVGAAEGNLRCVDSLPFRCSRCGRRDVAVQLFRERRELRRFMAQYR